jgi:hypothetical protein
MSTCEPPCEDCGRPANGAGFYDTDDEWVDCCDDCMETR